MNKLTLWLRWIAANAFGEMLGLGLTFTAAGLLISGLGKLHGVWLVTASFFIAVVTSVIEATLVGFAQYWAMHPWFPAIPRRAWWMATLAGVLVAYVLGYLPSTLMDLGEQAAPAQAPVAEPPQFVVLLLAAGLGMVGGAVLSFAQWRVLRPAARGAGWWIPANMLAWTAGMPVIFWGIDASQKGQPLPQALLLIAGALLLAGLVVGAVHGAFLAWVIQPASV